MPPKNLQFRNAKILDKLPVRPVNTNTYLLPTLSNHTYKPHLPLNFTSLKDDVIILISDGLDSFAICQQDNVIVIILIM